MIIVEGRIILADVITDQFLCNLNACKGACCWEGDYGAPLEEAEAELLAQIFPTLKPFLTDEGIEAIERQGTHVVADYDKSLATTLVNNGPCAYMTRNALGIAQCGIEQAYRAGAVAFQKPISCHLYPIRLEMTGDYETLRYDRWEICDAACAAGRSAKLPLYKFAKDALVRKYGEAFYEELEAAAYVFLKEEFGEDAAHFF